MGKRTKIAITMFAIYIFALALAVQFMNSTSTPVKFVFGFGVGLSAIVVYMWLGTLLNPDDKQKIQSIIIGIFLSLTRL
jgi:hypothetical protein